MRILRISFHLFLIILVGSLVYAGTLDVPFQYDDTVYIVENPLIKNLEHFGDLSSHEIDREQDVNNISFFRHLNFKLRYVGHLSFALNYMFGGLDVRGYHIVNLIIHLANALLVYVLVRLVLADFMLAVPRGTVALFSALLFVSHPVQTQAVTYITQRFASLAAMAYLLSLILYICFRRSGKKHLLFFSLVSAVLAMKTKEIAFTLPIVIAMYDFTFFKDTLRKRLPRLIPHLVTLLIIPLTILDSGRPAGEAIAGVARTKVGISSYEYLLTQFRVMVTYIRLLFLPVNQNIDYDYPLYSSILEPPVLLSFLFLCGIFTCCTYLLYRTRNSQGSEFGRISNIYYKAADNHTSNITHHASRLVVFGIFWFFITLSVESSIIPLADVIYEHRLYLPSVGFFTALATGAFLVNEGFGRRSRSPVISLAALIIMLSFTASARNSVWESEISLWKDAVIKSPHKARPHNNLGKAYLSKGVIEEAENHYRIALRIDPKYATAHNNLAVMYSNGGQYNVAMYHLSEAIRLNPKDETAQFNMGCIYKSRGQLERSVHHYNAALKISPRYAEAHNNIANVFVAQGKEKKAIEHYKAALMANPGLKIAIDNIKLILSRTSHQYDVCPKCGVPRELSDHRKKCLCG
jgi:tetratricopeptide (TPR) repeat protein